MITGASNIRYLMVIIGLFITVHVQAQYPPSHDPSQIIRDGSKYYIFSTGDGIWTMSSSSPDFTTWQAEPAPFANGWPSWINNYVSGFQGFFWAPDCIYMNGRYYLYYSASTGQRPCAIGVASTASLNNPNWVDHGMVVYSNNSTPYGSIDPDVFFDQQGRLWLAWGSHLMGIVLTELNPSTGKPYNANNYYNLADSPAHDLEAASIIYRNGYYYLFFNRNTCCAGTSSTYTIYMGRSTSVTGPYLDKNGNNCLSSGGSVFLSSSGRFIGPGHFGYSENRLTYHFYDGQDNGAPKVRVSTLGWDNGWPYAGSTPPSGPVVSGGTYRITPRHSGKAIDVVNCGNTDGTNVNQWSWLNNNCQKWVFTEVGGSYRVSPVSATNMALDVENCNSANLTNVRLWSWLNNNCQKWELLDRGSGYYSMRSVATGKCLDVNGISTADGANVIQYDCISGNYNQQFRFESTSASLLAKQGAVEAEIKLNEVYPNPVDDYLNIKLSDRIDGVTSFEIIDSSGKVWLKDSFKGQQYQIQTDRLPSGIYILNYENVAGSYTQKISKP
ncbi:family 43 glycosylhydrolase [Fulvivirga ligni]|uniref:family 43 glycosylhydrolase n=1 Tax=Fulvivirga ligni TaxID=2904246 RepID=UPI001F434ED9|nr:family 43 glycosylhydrolase [Fulvivirga ligni]UII23444.1 family 43 glycosylhydrolase [Fulvivirga ligni]